MNSCVHAVQQTVPKSSFDAYISPRGKTRTFGNEEETAAFRRCMSAKGFTAE